MTTCPRCNGKCCLDAQRNRRCTHAGTSVYVHVCDCNCGSVPDDPRDTLIAAMRETIDRVRELCECVRDWSRDDRDGPTAHERVLAIAVLDCLPAQEKGDA